jgi:flagellar basal-body rod protein FlgB
MVDRIFGGALEHVVRGLGHAAKRHDILSRNVSNLATPGYRARDLAFDDYLRAPAPSAPGETAVNLPLDPTAPRPRVVYAADGPPRPDGNDVNLDRQMARLAENSLFHNALAQLLAGQFAALRQAITGRV